jgi:uncharacterized protein (TIGR03067 family)
MDANPRRRWFRFSLRTLFLAILTIASVCGWIGYRYRTVSMETQAVGGRWRMFTVDGNPILKGDGTVYTIEFCEFNVDPFHEPRWLDQYSPRGKTVRAIYRWDGDEMLITAASPGDERPTALVLTRTMSEPGSSGQPNITAFRLRRIRD